MKYFFCGLLLSVTTLASTTMLILFDENRRVPIAIRMHQIESMKKISLADKQEYYCMYQTIVHKSDSMLEVIATPWKRIAYNKAFARDITEELKKNSPSTFC